ncbi:uncharacterized protein LOC110703994 [Chenopodium quinoa]|uniref:uncharacterized protein LOC110703994 n=1 Tax=Chenopodium quinoa TaxID=63459 RepID=UPI000B791DB6|nr:uncharacterized protein LOC110703994 [Chenopodium quinoa]
MGQTTVDKVEEFLQERDMMLEELKMNLVHAQQVMKGNADSKRREVEFKVGDHVFLKLQPIEACCPLLWAIRDHSARGQGGLQALKQAVGNVPSSPTIPPQITPELELVVEPEQVLDSRPKLGRSEGLEVLIKWLGVPEFESTWEDAEAIKSKFPDFNLKDKETGWAPKHIIAMDEVDNVIGVVPLYLKSHSYGEYVFDHSWANAYYSYGSRYYPKLQSCVPFTPVTGPRILLRNTACKDEIFDIVVSALKDLTTKFQVSSMHVTFSNESQWQRMKEKGFLQRIGMQYHWKNRNYKNFDGFLMDLKQSKRKNIRQERKKISAQNLTMKRLRGYEIKAKHWDTFYQFYKNTTDNKWGTPYLTRDFFHNMASKMGDQVLLVTAEEQNKLVAGALNLIGGDTMYGRLWGCLPESYYPSLHFEACYYQAIEAAIEFNLDKVEAGAQGEHKIQRGYLPVTTYSCHYIVDEEFRKAIKDFLVRETDQMMLVMKVLRESGPFKDDIKWDIKE